MTLGMETAGGTGKPFPGDGTGRTPPDPSISVIMGIYNCGETLRESVESIRAQTYENWELIMYDDGSMDDTAEIAESYARLDPERIILIRGRENRKLSHALNECLKAANGELIARMDGDDISLPERFEKQVRFLREHPEFQLVGTGMETFNETGSHEIKTLPEHPDRYTILRTVPFYHATVMTWRYVYESLGGYTEEPYAERVEDVDLWFRFFHQGYRGANLPEALYRVREDVNAIRRRTVQNRINAFRTLKKGYRLMGFPRRWLVMPALKTAVKCLVPFRVVQMIRKVQGRL